MLLLMMAAIFSFVSAPATFKSYFPAKYSPGPALLGSTQNAGFLLPSSSYHHAEECNTFLPSYFISLISLPLTTVILVISLPSSAARTVDKEIVGMAISIASKKAMILLVLHIWVPSLLIFGIKKRDTIDFCISFLPALFTSICYLANICTQ